MRALPAGPRYALAGAGGHAWYRLSREQGRAARHNYGAVLGRAPDDPATDRLARAAFANYGRMLADFVLLGSIQPAELAARVSLDGREHLDAALAGGRGCIMAVPHMGSWDVGGSIAGVLGYRIAAVTERFPGSLDEAVAGTRRALGMRVIPSGRAAVRQVLTELRSNSIVALVCDLPDGPGLEVELFGRRVVLPGGPAALAVKSGAPVLPACTWRSGPGRYHVHIEAALAPPSASGREGAGELMQAVARRFEAFIRERPEEWYAFRPVLG